MTKKKRFGISEALTRGLTETINVVENNAGIYRNIILPLSRIELDPENPRKLTIDLNDVRHGLRPDDPKFVKKQEELERLKELAHTIKSSGIINPVVVYKNGEVYRIVAGERRCLASILAGKQEIEARVFNEKPKGYDLKLIQWIENTAREDLSLDERLGNVREIIHEYKLTHEDIDITATLLKSITGLSLSQTTYYLAAINAPEDVQQNIKNGSIRNLDKAALIASVQAPDVREKVMQACANGFSLKDLRQLISQHKTMKRSERSFQPAARGRAAAKINLGSTPKVQVVKTIVDSVLEHRSFEHYHTVFAKVDWHDMRQATKAFRKLIEIMETETVA